MTKPTYEETTAKLIQNITDISSRDNVTVADIESIEKDFKAWGAITLALTILHNDNKLKEREH